MKAILEIKMPKSCWECRFKENGTGEYSDVTYCGALDGYIFDKLLDHHFGRAPFCPLKPVDEHKESRNVDVGENCVIYCPSCKRKIGVYHGKNYCPDCGQKLNWTGVYYALLLKEQFADTASGENLARFAALQGFVYDTTQSDEENRVRINALMKEQAEQREMEVGSQ